MKMKLTRISKRTLSMVLTVLIMFSMIIVGTVTNANASALNGYIYFSNVKTKWNDVYCFLGKNDYLRSYRMTLDSNGVWKTNYQFNNEFSDATGIFFASSSGGYSVLSGSSSFNISNRSSLGLTEYTATSSTVQNANCYVPATASNNTTLTCTQTQSTVKSNNGKVELPTVTDTDLKNVINNSYVQIFMGEDISWGDKDYYYLQTKGTTTHKATSLGNNFEFKVNSDSIYLQATKTAVASTANAYSLSNSSSWAGVTITKSLGGGDGYFLTSSGSWGDCSGSAGSASGNYAYYLKSASASLSTTSKTITQGESAGTVSATITKGYYSYHNGGNEVLHMVYYAKDSSGNLYKIGTSSDISSSSASTTLSNTQYLPVGTYTVYGVMNDDVINVRASNTFTLTVKNPTRNVEFSYTGSGSLTVDGSSTSPKSVNIGSTYTVVATPDTGWRIASLTIDGSSVSDAVGKTTYHTESRVMSEGTSPVRVTAVFEQDYPDACTSVTLSRSPSDHLYTGENCTFTATAVNPQSGVTYHFYVDGSSVQNTSSNTYTTKFNDTKSHTIYVIVEGNKYSPVRSDTLTVTPTSTNVTATKNVTYYIDFHNNTLSSNPKIKFNTTTTETALTKQVNSTVYSAVVPTPYTYNALGDKDVALYDIPATISVNNSSYNVTIVKEAIETKEVWLEAANETSQTLSMTPATPERTVKSGYKRIYLDRVTAKNTWSDVYIYCWDDTNGEFHEWKNSDKMIKFKTTTSDVYYYFDVPTKNATNVIFHNGSGKQTADIKDIGTTNYFQLDSTDNASPMSTVIAAPGCTLYYKDVKMNLKETESGNVNIAPTLSNLTFTVTYTSSSSSVATIDSTGNIIPHTSGETKITVKVSNSLGDSVSYTTNIKINDPDKFGGFKVMSIESQISTISISPAGAANFLEVSTLLTGVANVPKNSSNGYKNSAIVTIDGSNCTVRYAKPNTQFSGYENIFVTATVKTKSERYTSSGKRYGINYWEKNSEKNAEINKTVTKSITDGVETATSKMTLDGSTFNAVYSEYDYVDVTFVFDYYEYKTLRKVEKKDSKGDNVLDEKGNPVYEELDFYQYDPEYVGDEDRNSPDFKEDTHIHKIYTVNDFEVRDLTADTITTSNMLSYAGDAIENMPENDYYTYELSEDVIQIKKDTEYTATVTVKMKHKPRTYSVSVNAEEITRYDSGKQQYVDQNETPVYYQAYIRASAPIKSNWYEAESGEKKGGILAIGTSYRFRVTKDTELVTDSNISGDDNDNRTAISLSGYELTHEKSTSDPTKEVEKLIQNFYIADFFDPAKVVREDGTPRDDVKFVGGGVAYYSYTNDSGDNKTFNQSAIDAGYVHGQDDGDSVYGEANADTIKNRLKTVIEKNIPSSDVTDSTDLAKAIAYGTEIKVTVDKNTSNRSTGLVYRYLPYEQYKYSEDNKTLEKDDEGNYTFATKINSNVFRYSTALKAYQYIYASKAENKESNSNKYMRTYSYYIYSYTSYDEETDLPTTEYEVVLSDNYSDAATYWKNTP